MIEFRRGPAQKAPRPLSTVEYATPLDLDDLVWFLHAMREEIGDGQAEEDKLVALASAMVRSTGGVALIVRGKTKIEASLGLVFNEPLLNSKRYFLVAWNCVLPEARVTGHAKSLLAKAKVLADQLQRPLLLEEFSPDPDSGKVKLAARHLKPFGQLFRHLPEAV